MPCRWSTHRVTPVRFGRSSTGTVRRCQVRRKKGFKPSPTSAEDSKRPTNTCTLVGLGYPSTRERRPNSREADVRRILLLLAAATVMVALLAPTASAATVRLTKIEKRVLTLVNAERTKRGLAPLRVQRSLTRAARVHSRNMAITPFFSHISPSGRTPGARVRSAGYTTTGWTRWRVGETIAWGTGALATPEAIVYGWMHSRSHKRILLSRGFRDIGIGTACGTFVSGDRTLDNVRYFTVDVGARLR